MIEEDDLTYYQYDPALLEYAEQQRSQANSDRLPEWYLKHFPTLYHLHLSPDDHPNPQDCLKHLHGIWGAITEGECDRDGHPPFLWWPTLQEFSHPYLDSPDGHPVMRVAIAK